VPLQDEIEAAPMIAAIGREAANSIQISNNDSIAARGSRLAISD
jgi:hypothetical protein